MECKFRRLSLPLAVVDMYQCTIRIYSSAINTPVYDIKPSTLVNPVSMLPNLEKINQNTCIYSIDHDRLLDN